MKILFVCLGNICRSPTAEGIAHKMIKAQNLADVVHLDSAGTSGWHQGQAPDERSQKAALKRGYDLSKLKSRQVTLVDFYEFDLILAMDHRNLSDLLQMRPSNGTAEVDLYLRRFNIATGEVPDPYYGGQDGFNHVIDLLEQVTIALIAEIKCKLSKI